MKLTWAELCMRLTVTGCFCVPCLLWLWWHCRVFGVLPATFITTPPPLPPPSGSSVGMPEEDT